MNRSDKCGCGGICYILAAIFIIILALLMLGNSDFIKWADSHSGLAAWVQAFFSIVAIVSAFGVAFYQNLKAREAEDYREKQVEKIAKRIIKWKINDDYAVLGTIRNTFQKATIETSACDYALSVAYKVVKDIDPLDTEIVRNLRSTDEVLLKSLISSYEHISRLKALLKLHVEIVEPANKATGGKIDSSSTYHGTSRLINVAYGRLEAAKRHFQEQ